MYWHGPYHSYRANQYGHTLLSDYDWERLLRWQSRGPESPGVMVSSSRYGSSTIPRAATSHVLLELPRSNRISPLGIGLDETNKLCACFAYDVPSGTIVEQLDGDFLHCCPSDMDLHHPFNIRT